MTAARSDDHSDGVCCEWAGLPECDGSCTRSAATLRQDALEWATTLEFAGAEQMGAEWKDAGLSRKDADELAALLRALAANQRTGRIIHGDA